MIELTRENYRAEVEAAQTPVLIDFRAEGTLDVPECEDYKFCRVDVGRQGELARQFDILRVPTLVWLEHGKIVQRICGDTSRDALRRILDLN